MKYVTGTMRTTTGKYKDFADRGMIPIQLDTLGYPPSEDPGERHPLKGSGVRYKLKIPTGPLAV